MSYDAKSSERATRCNTPTHPPRFVERLLSRAIFRASIIVGVATTADDRVS
jgi:hypothetical protein